MPRSSQLKSVGIPLDGVHKMIDCPFCDKKHIRSDNFGSHLQTEMKKHGASTALDMWSKFQDGFVCVGDVLVKQEGTEDSLKNVGGICFDCNKYIYNKEPQTQKVFEEHVCKEKKIAAAENAKHPPATRDSVMKDLFTAIKTGTKMTAKQMELLKTCREFAVYDSEFSDGYSEAIEDFVRKLCMMAAVPAGEYEKDFKAAFPELADYTLEQIKNHFARLNRIIEKNALELSKVRTEVEQLYVQNEELSRDLDKTKKYEENFDREREVKEGYKAQLVTQEQEIIAMKAELRKYKIAMGEIKPEADDVD